MRYLAAALLLFVVGSDARAWGNKGHQVIALIAWHYLSPGARSDIETLLQRDNSGLTNSDIASAATWADLYRDSDRDTTKTRYEQTRRWHYINLELAHPDFTRACFGSLPLQPRQNAADGPAKACIVDKIEQFATELEAANTTPAERLLALQFLIHLVGDLHQPLHASDNDDGGGNDVYVTGSGFKHGTLHGYWDNAVVHQLGRKPVAIARKLIARTDATQLALWRRGTPRDWAFESLTLAKDTAYAKLPPSDTDGIHVLDRNYAEKTKIAAAQQMTKAGVRLAWLLERSIAPQ